MHTRTAQYDVVIVGAGIAGLNALFAASKLVRTGGRIALVDRREHVGGMWNDVYDYVRLHQAHPLFTAGNIRWRWDKDPLYLATKPEVLDHLQYCRDVLADRVQLTDFLGWSYEGHVETGGAVRTTIVRDGQAVVLESRKLVKAYGLNVPTNPPLALSSAGVRSVSPDDCDVRVGEIAASAAPVWVIGGGKTGMDTVHTLVTAAPGREVNLVAGSGTLFTNRERMYPEQRWIGGIRPFALIKAFHGYDGTNHDLVFEQLERRCGAKVTETTGNWLSGILSATEADTISRGLRRTLTDHLVDVLDEDGQPTMLLRSGARIPLEPGSWVINCTGYLARTDLPYEPYVSASGNVCSINDRSCTMLYSSFAGYFLTHLLLRDKLHKVPFYEVDLHDLRERSRLTAVAGMLALIHNLAVMMDRLPPSVFLGPWGTNFDRIYPAHRWLYGALEFSATHWRERRRARIALDNIRERYGVRSGPLGAFEPATSAAAGVRS